MNPIIAFLGIVCIAVGEALGAARGTFIRLPPLWLLRSSSPPHSKWRIPGKNSSFCARRDQLQKR